MDFVMSLILNVIYFTIFETLYGASPGKIILGMRVVQMNGQPCSIGKAFVRAMMRFIDGFIFGAIAAVNMKPPFQQRPGDKLASTIVVDSDNPLIQVQRPWWMALIAGLIYCFLAAIGVGIVFALALL